MAGSIRLHLSTSYAISLCCIVFGSTALYSVALLDIFAVLLDFY